MAAEFLITLATPEQIRSSFTGEFIKGRREPRIAMVGRSNVGKSSLINALLKTRLAKVSAEPGKTRAIHMYYWKEATKVVTDLPGYGFAKASKEERNRWADFIQLYFKTDAAIDRALILLDARHGPTPIDLDAIEFLSGLRVPMSFVFTKFDQLKTQKDRAARKKEADQALRNLGYDGPEALWVSVKSGHGLKPLTHMLSES